MTRKSNTPEDQKPPAQEDPGNARGRRQRFGLLADGQFAYVLKELPPAPSSTPEKLQPSPSMGYSDTSMEREKAALIHELDAVRAMLLRRPELLSVFRNHAVGELLRPQAKRDPIAQEIALEVTTEWDPQLNEPWAENPALFVRHVYKKWRDAGTLRRGHLAHDQRLYDAYRQHVKRHPEDDLNLPKEVRKPVVDAKVALQQKRDAATRYARKKRGSVL